MITKLICGGQTGADTAALDVALRHAFPHGGWCPKGRKSEDGPIPLRYLLTETPSASYLQRTEWNVRDTDGTVVFPLASTVTGGSLRTIDFAKKHEKPWIHINRTNYRPAEELQVRGGERDQEPERRRVTGEQGARAAPLGHSGAG